jgi:hypothetical protein
MQGRMRSAGLGVSRGGLKCSRAPFSGGNVLAHMASVACVGGQRRARGLLCNAVAESQLSSAELRGEPPLRPCSICMPLGGH